MASFEQALTCRPNNPDALANRANVLLGLGRYDDAFDDLAQALRVDPNSFDAHLNRGNLYSALARMDDALADFIAADRICPDDPDANFNAALALLCMGRFKDGWDKYEYRFKQQQRSVMLPKFPRPIWRGDVNIRGMTIALVAEQGIGDAIQFVRYAPMLAALGAKVVLGVHRPLARLMELIAGVAQVVADGATLPDFDIYCSLLSLPMAFGTGSVDDSFDRALSACGRGSHRAVARACSARWPAACRHLLGRQRCTRRRSPPFTVA